MAPAIIVGSEEKTYAQINVQSSDEARILRLVRKWGWKLVNLQNPVGQNGFEENGDTVVLNSTPETWETHIIKDGIGNASTNPINIFGSGSLIDGLSSVSIASDWAAISVVYNGTRWGII